MLRLLSILLALALAASTAGCGGGGHRSASPRNSSPGAAAQGQFAGGGFAGDEADDGVEVPDVSNGDGDDAWQLVEDAELDPTFADANEDPGFDSSRDGTGCDVTDQDPAAGETVEPEDEVEVTIDCAQVDWENQEGPGWEAFSDGYQSGFDDGCEELFSESPDGSLYEDDSKYTSGDCQNLNPGDASNASDVPTEAPEDPESAGSEVGELDGCQALFEEQGVYSLNWGEDSITEGDCPVGSYVPPAPKKTTTHTETADSICSAADGVEPIRVDKGKINCSGARALWQEYMRRAPGEGIGSGGFLNLEGWTCFAAPPVEVEKSGGCDRTDHSAGFTVLKME